MQCSKQQRLVFVAAQALVLATSLLATLQSFDEAVMEEEAAVGHPARHPAGVAARLHGEDMSPLLGEEALVTSTAQVPPASELVSEESDAAPCEEGRSWKFLILLPFAFVGGGVLNSETFLKAAALAV